MKSILVFSFLFLISSVGYVNVAGASGEADFDTFVGEWSGEIGAGLAGAAATAGAGGSGSEVFSAVAGAVGGAFIQKGLKKPPNYYFVALGTLGIAQAANAAKASKQNRKVKNQICLSGCDEETGGLAGVDAVADTYGLDRHDAAQVKKQKQLAEKKGFSVSGGNLITPDKTIPLSKLGSLAGFGKAFGLSKQQLVTMQQDIDKIKAKVLKKYGGKRIGLVGGSGSSRSKRFRRKVVYEDGNSSFRNNNLNKKRYVASVNGLAKKLGDSMIGVKGDNIFNIIHRSYKSKKELLLKQ